MHLHLHLEVQYLNKIGDEKFSKLPNSFKFLHVRTKVKNTSKYIAYPIEAATKNFHPLAANQVTKGLYATLN